jgi:hypothetical protein
MTAILKVDTIQDTAGNNIINESSDTITIGASGDTIALAGTTVTGITQGITMADGYRQNSDVNHGTGDPVLDSNWEKIDTDSFGFIGTGMSESSGIFTFPATGIYYIAAQCSINDASATNRVDWRIQTTVDNSSYADNSISHMNIPSSNYRGNGFCSTIFDVQNTSNYKLRFALYDINNVNPSTIGSTSETFTGFMVYRLGDT